MTDLIIYEQRTIAFYGDELAAIQTDRGIYVPVKPICEVLGIDWEGQRQRIMRDEVLHEGACILKAPSAGGPQDMLCLPDDMLHGWLFGVSTNQIAIENREHLLRYKRECYRVLHQAFTQHPIMPEALARVEARLDARIDALAREVAQLKAERGAPVRSYGPRRLLRLAEPAPGEAHFLDASMLIAVLEQAGEPLRTRQVLERLIGIHGNHFRRTQVSNHLRRLARRGAIAHCGPGLFGVSH